MRINIHVTANDIKKGKRRRAGSCPIALAATRAIGKPCFVSLIDLDVEGYRFPIYLPLDARTFVTDFDYDYGRPKPFSFAIDMPEGR